MRSPIAMVLISVFSLWGCANVNQTLANKLDNSTGQHIDELISVLGFPSEEKTFAGRNVFVWYHQDTVSTSHSFFTGSYWDKTFDSRTVYCRISIEIDDSQIVQGNSFDSTDGGCGYYVDRINRLEGL